MFAIPGILALLVLIHVRPQEFLLSLRALPLLYLFLGLAFFGYALDLRLRRSRLRPSPQLRWVIYFFLWCAMTVVVRARDQLPSILLGLTISLIFYVVIAHAVQTFRAFEVV